MWFQLNNNPEIEYSTNFDFFVKNQIAVVKSGRNYNFHSRLEVKTFRRVSAILRQNHELSNNEINSITKEIHGEILWGKFGHGIIVK